MSNVDTPFSVKSSSSSSLPPKRVRSPSRMMILATPYSVKSSSSSLLESSPSPSLHTRSPDLSDRTSFRVQGTEGEFDLIYRSLGLSGPDDFAISKEAWEARKVRSSSDLFPRSRILSFDEKSPKKEEDSEVAAELCERVLEVAVIRDVPESTRSAPAESSGCCTPSGGGVGGGIKGVRPPLLKPPPPMRLPEIDKTTSTWDLFKDFGPIDEINSSTRVIEENSSDDEEEHPEEEEQEVKEDKKEVYKEIVQEQEKDSEARLVVVEEQEKDSEGTISDEKSASPSETYSFYTANDDDFSSRFRRSITPWQKGDLLGCGSFGSVYEGISEDGFFFAVKEVSLLDEGSQGKQSIYQLEQEIALLSQFEHENIVQYYGTDKDESKLYIFLELVTKGSLQSLYQKYILRDAQVSAYTRQILQGLKYLHDRNIVHRDIKCANILVDASGSVLLADFGLAKAIKLNDVKSCKGTAFWMAPEVINRTKWKEGYGLPADIWSLGCTVLEMLTRKIPYSNLEWMQALFSIGKGVLPSVPDSLSKDARDFIWKCLQVNPHARATAAGLLNHSFVKRRLPTSSGSASPYLLGAQSC